MLLVRVIRNMECTGLDCGQNQESEWNKVTQLLSYLFFQLCELAGFAAL